MKNSFVNVLSSDFFKARKLKSVWIAIILTFAMSLFLFVTTTMLEVSIKSMRDLPEVKQEDILALQLTLVTLKQSVLFGSTSIGAVELFVLIICCIFVGKDFSSGAINLMVARGVSKRNIYLSKFVTLSTIVLAYSVISLIFNGIFIAIGGLGYSFTSNDGVMLIRNFFLQILCGISSMSIYLMIAFLTRSSGSSLACSIGSYFLLSLLISILLSFGGTSPDSTAWTVFLPLSQMDIACTYGKWSTINICAVAIMPVFYTIISSIIGYTTFAKRDLK